MALDEKYSVPLKDLDQEQEHLVVFRVVDSYRNVGVGKFVFSLQNLGSVVPQEPQPSTP